VSHRLRSIESFLADVLALAGEEPDAVRDEVRVALGELLDGIVLTVLIVVAIGTIYYGIRLVKELRRSTRR
jgi:hypothetical protein